MTAYRTSTKIKLGLIAAAVLIAVASLVFTSRLADRLEAQDAAAVALWADAIKFQTRVSFSAQLADPSDWDDIEDVVLDSQIGEDERARLLTALERARDEPQNDGLDFVFTHIIEPARFSVPAVLTDSAMTSVLVSRNLGRGGSDESVLRDEELLQRARAMDAINAPIRIQVSQDLVQFVHYGESPLARLIRMFPFVQLALVGLFILVGYLGFSYVRRSEQSSLWVGMAREAAHQLGTPLSSMIAWIELLRLDGEEAVDRDTVADELEQDVDRLRRVADRFEKIGSTPTLDDTPVLPLLESVADYMRRRLPRSGDVVAIDVDASAGLSARVNPELFEWVIENLIKNALDAMEGMSAPDGQHRIRISAAVHGSDIAVDVSDTGKGMDRATARHVFRPGFSTKRRGWGLGLSLARRIVEDYHGGSLSVASTRPGAGTTFRIEVAKSGEAASGLQADDSLAPSSR